MQSWTYWTYKSFDDITTQNALTESFFNASGTVLLGVARFSDRIVPEDGICIG
jgi:hypothetical protein